MIASFVLRAAACAPMAPNQAPNFSPEISESFSTKCACSTQ